MHDNAIVCDIFKLLKTQLIEHVWILILNKQMCLNSLKVSCAGLLLSNQEWTRSDSWPDDFTQEECSYQDRECYRTLARDSLPSTNL